MLQPLYKEDALRTTYQKVSDEVAKKHWDFWYDWTAKKCAHGYTCTTCGSSPCHWYLIAQCIAGCALGMRHQYSEPPMAHQTHRAAAIAGLVLNRITQRSGACAGRSTGAHVLGAHGCTPMTSSQARSVVKRSATVCRTNHCMTIGFRSGSPAISHILLHEQSVIGVPAYVCV